MADRRETLKIVGAIGATCAFPFASDELYGQHAHPVSAEATHEPTYFDRDDLALIKIVCDLIVPDTGTPGAVKAGVPAYIDLVAGRNPEHQKTFRAGLAWLREQKFAALSESERIALLTPLSNAVDRNRVRSAPERFFQTIKSMTADGYYTSRIGMQEELGFKGGAVLAGFPSCEVPEH